jgi:hypothetical protein
VPSRPLRSSVWLNLFLPGCGLIHAGRDRAGVAYAAAFVASAQIALLGWLVAPAAIPLRLTLAAGVAAVVIYLAAQRALWRRTS